MYIYMYIYIFIINLGCSYPTAPLPVHKHGIWQVTLKLAWKLRMAIFADGAVRLANRANPNFTR